MQMNDAFIPPEIVALAIVLIVLGLGYQVLHPRLAGNDLKKLVLNDVLAMGAAILCVGWLYWDSQLKFSLIFFDVNWFLFTLISYSILEIPLFNRYIKKHKINLDFDR